MRFNHVHIHGIRTWRASSSLISFLISFSSMRCSPSVPQLYNNLCVLFRNMKKFDDSRKAATQCLAALPHYAPALNNLALLQVTLGQLMDADDNLRAAIDADHGLSCAQSNAMSLQVLMQPLRILLLDCA